MTQVVGRLVQDNKVALMSQASFGIARQSTVNILDRPQMDMCIHKLISGINILA